MSAPGSDRASAAGSAADPDTQAWVLPEQRGRHAAPEDDELTTWPGNGHRPPAGPPTLNEYPTLNGSGPNGSGGPNGHRGPDGHASPVEVPADGRHVVAPGLAAGTPLVNGSGLGHRPSQSIPPPDLSPDLPSAEATRSALFPPAEPAWHEGQWEDETQVLAPVRMDPLDGPTEVLPLVPPAQLPAPAPVAPRRQRIPSRPLQQPVAAPPTPPGGAQRTGAAAPPHPPRAVRRRRQRRRRLLEWPFLVVFSLLAAFLLRTFVVQTFYIPSQSMHDTLLEGDKVLVNKLAFKVHDINRGDVVVFRRPANIDIPDEDLIKRVIGLPGDRIEGRGGKVYINGQLLIEPYVQKGCTEGTVNLSAVLVPAGHVFVMGDNRCDSTDSRVFGAVDDSLVVGRAFVLIWPVGRLGWL
ncbi:MAG TPA: signal peptidase I [Mycobacteriales bacterium]|nr:signal peptidase I [Mycobacteriales bacterium]